MALNTEKLRDHIEDEYPVDVMGIYINRSGVRVQYLERYGDGKIDRQLRKSQLTELIDSYMKKAAYMDASLDRNSEMMLQLESGEVDIVVQRVSNKKDTNSPDEYRIRQDVALNSKDQYIFSTKFYAIDCKEAADVTAKTLREYVCSDSEKKYVLELQHFDTSEQYTAFARFHTNSSFSTIMGLETQG